jgi:hypothetical protein
MFVVLVNQSAWSADENDKFAALGAGVVSCSRFLEARELRSKEYFLFGGWIEGYLSSINQREKDTYTLVPWQSVDVLAGFLAEYCSKNPDHAFLKAVASMAAALRPQRLSTASERIAVSVNQYKKDFFREVLARMQKKLSERGYYNGETKGDFDKTTATALGLFQRDAGIEVSGFPDQKTLFRLFYER